ncbi:MAG: hypothetical protein ACK4J0_02155 [Candidatus Anstonellaceae archaeon]
MKAQTSVEYIVIIAVVLFFGLLVLALAGFFPSFSFSAQEQTSKTFWESATPISILDAYQSNNNLFLVLENKAKTTLNLSSITLIYGLKEYYLNSSQILLFPGQIYTTSLSVRNCTKNQVLSYQVIINYSTETQNNLIQKSTKELFVKCN